MKRKLLLLVLSLFIVSGISNTTANSELEVEYKIDPYFSIIEQYYKDNLNSDEKIEIKEIYSKFNDEHRRLVLLLANNTFFRDRIN